MTKTMYLTKYFFRYVYVLNGVSISVYSVQTGDCTHQFMTEPKEDLVCYTIFKEFLIAVSPTNSLSVWNLNEKSTRNIQVSNIDWDVFLIF